jgi:hypothetical protein
MVDSSIFRVAWDIFPGDAIDLICLGDRGRPTNSINRMDTMCQYVIVMDDGRYTDQEIRKKETLSFT